MGVSPRFCGLLLLGLLSAQAFVIKSGAVLGRSQLFTFSNERTITAAVGSDGEPNPNDDISNTRSVVRVEKDPRLPVWPVANGVLLWLLGRLSPNLAAQLEDVITGRVCPMPLDATADSPFVLLVHHVHSFAPWDPIRWIQRRLILPEGFPSHPHRGFVTLTYVLEGAFVHRDSLGQRQVYGNHDRRRNRRGLPAPAGANSTSSLPHSQWLYTGAGVLHEEMFLNDPWPALWTRQELFQLWINCPRARKYGAPFSVLLGGDDDDDDVDDPNAPAASSTPLVEEDGATTRVLAGCFKGRCSAAPLSSPLVVLHVRLAPGATWVWDDDAVQDMATALLYVRRGRVTCQGTTIAAHHRARLDGSPRRVVLRAGPEQPADLLFLAGAPLGEPVAQQGSFVLTSPEEVDRAYADYQVGAFGRPWDHELSDEAWRRHVQTFPCVYKSADDK